MANYYLRSTDGNDGNAGTPAAPWATMASAATQMAAGSRCYVSANHAELTAAAITIDSAGTPASPIEFICIEDWGAETDPGSITHTASTGASVGTNGGYSLSFKECLYCQGITFGAGNGAGYARFNFCLAGLASYLEQFEYFRNCTFVHDSNYSVRYGASYQPGGCLLVLDGCTWNGNYASSSWDALRGDLWFRNVSWTGTPATVLFAPGQNNKGEARIRLDNCDLSIFHTGKAILDPTNANMSTVTVDLYRCRLGSGVALTSGAFQSQGSGHVRLVECDHATNYIQQAKADYNGIITEDTVRVRDNSNSSYSHKLVSTANTKFYSPLRSFPVARYNATEGSAITVRVEVLTDGVTLTDGEFWIEANYLGSASYPLGSIASSAKSDILASASNLSTSTEGWTTTDLATPVKQYATVTFTPQKTGIIEIVGCLAKASTTVYVDPDPTVS